MNRGTGGTNGRWRRRLVHPLTVALCLLAVAIAGNLVRAANAQLYAGQPVALFRPIVDELTSGIVWLAALPIIVWAFRHITPARLPWLVVLAGHAVMAHLVALGHDFVTDLARALFYLLRGEQARIDLDWNRIVANVYQGDLLNYLLFGMIWLGAERLLAPSAAAETVPDQDCAADPVNPVIAIRDGAQTVYLPAEQILWAEAAGNYVELHATGARCLLMRTTLASLAAQLVPAGFLRVHRSRLVNVGKITTIENLPSGDSLVILSNGDRITTSRRYRSELFEAMATRTAIPEGSRRSCQDA